MGGLWCKVDRGQPSYSPRGPFNTALSRWTDHMRQAYRKPKTQHRPPRPPQKPARVGERPTISAPTLVREASSDGWRTATLVVPEVRVQAGPVPPPRKKRRRDRELGRTAVSMGDLNRGSQDLSRLGESTISLPDAVGSTTAGAPEPRVEEHGDENKENVHNSAHDRIEEEDQPEIIPIEKETLFTSRTLLHSNLGYVDKLSAISEVSAESGFDDKTDHLKSSEESGSVTSAESVPRETGLNILAHIRSLNSVGESKENCVDIREKTAVSKKEWLENILNGGPDPYYAKEIRRGSDSVAKGTVSEEVTGQPNSLPTDDLHLMNREAQTSEEETKADNHSVLLDIIQKNKDTEIESTISNFLHHKEESIFLTNTKTNIIYKSLSSDNLTDDYDIDYSDVTAKTVGDSANGRLHSAGTNQFNGVTPSHLSDYSFPTPKLVEPDGGLNSLLADKRSNVISSFDFKEIRPSNDYASDLHSLPNNDSNRHKKKIIVNSIEISPRSDRSSEHSLENTAHDVKPMKESLEKKNSVSSSRKSSITDSLHEFEMSIYDMLKESKKNENSSDEEDSLKTVK